VSFVQPDGSRSAEEGAADASSVQHHAIIATTLEPSDIHASAALPPAYVPNSTTSTALTLHGDTNTSTSITEPSFVPSPQEGKKSNKRRKKATKESLLEVPETGPADVTQKEADEPLRQTRTPMEHAQQASTPKAVVATPAKESSVSISGTQIGLYRCIFLIPVLLKFLLNAKAKETQPSTGNLPVRLASTLDNEELRTDSKRPKELAKLKSKMRKKTTSAG